MILFLHKVKISRKLDKTIFNIHYGTTLDLKIKKNIYDKPLFVDLKTVSIRYSVTQIRQFFSNRFLIFLLNAIS